MREVRKKNGVFLYESKERIPSLSGFFGSKGKGLRFKDIAIKEKLTPLQSVKWSAGGPRRVQAAHHQQRHETRTSVAQRQIRPESVREWSPSSGTWWPSDHPLTPPGVPVCRDPTNNFAQDCRITQLELLAHFYRSLGDSGRSSILSVLSLGLGLVMAAFLCPLFLFSL